MSYLPKANRHDDRLAEVGKLRTCDACDAVSRALPTYDAGWGVVSIGLNRIRTALKQSLKDLAGFACELGSVDSPLARHIAMSALRMSPSTPVASSG